jgi:hypothetical protein
MPTMRSVAASTWKSTQDPEEPAFLLAGLSKKSLTLTTDVAYSLSA